MVVKLKIMITFLYKYNTLVMMFILMVRGNPKMMMMRKIKQQ